MQHVVIGAGEVGQAIAEVLRKGPNNAVHLRDILDTPEGPAGADILHICFPYGWDFVADVRAYAEHYQPSLVIVHSTVPIGTTAELGSGAVHSPVTGKHPNLAQSILTFNKFFGGPRALEAAAIFDDCGVSTRCTRLAANTEAGKMWELAQYGINIVVEKAIHEYCEQQGLDFDIVYTEFAKNYNSGYSQLGDTQFVRPILKHVPGPIGGHCVVPGSLLLGHPLASLVAEAHEL